MTKYKMIISYDGTDYYGWQTLKGLPSIASTMQKVFWKTFGKEIILKGASRTDAGVHAMGQVVMFKTDLVLEADKIKFAWNNSLPADILIRSIEMVDESHSIYDDIAYKIYHYHFFTHRPLPFAQRYGYYHYYATDIEKLERCLQIFVGTHDFRSFASSEDERENMVRTIDSIRVEYLHRFGAYRIVVTGHSFLRHMVRRMVGAALKVASSKQLDASDLAKALDEKNPEQELPNAPAQGLMLYKIVYKK